MTATITFESRATDIITAAELEAIHVNLIANSAWYATHISQIMGTDQEVKIIIGYASDLGVSPNDAIIDFQSDGLGTVDTLYIPLEYLAHGYYDATHPMTIERVLSHEMGHVWQDAMKIRVDQSQPYDPVTNPYLITQDPAREYGNVNSSLNFENMSMASYGEPADPVYGLHHRDNYGGKISYYDANKNPVILDFFMSPVKVLSLIAEDIKSLFKAAIDEISPLVLDLDGDGVELTNLSTDAVYWDADKDGFAEASAWVSADDGLLAIDLDQDGGINDHGELFGNQTGQDNGFAALTQYDSNSDGKITNEDQDWNKLLVWKDTNQDGMSQASELHTLDSLNITQINLNATETTMSIAGNDISHTSTFTMNGNTRTIVDAWFKVDQTNSIDITRDIEIDHDALGLPFLRGYGDLHSLTVSMSLDNTGTGNLLDLVDNFNQTTFADLFAANNDTVDAVRDIMFRWAGVDTLLSTTRGPSIDARELVFLEKLTGEEFLQNGLYSNPGTFASYELREAFSIAFNHIYAMLAVQGAGRDLFTGEVVYNPGTDAIEGITGLDLTKLAMRFAIMNTHNTDNAFYASRY